MLTLSITTLIWAFSFSFIGVYLASDVDPYLAVWIRMILAFLVLAPFLRIRHTPIKRLAYIMAIGGVQIGLMYLLLYHAFLYLTVPEVLLFTIFTPLYIMLIDEVFVLKKKLPWHWWFAAALSVFGAGIIRYQSLNDDYLTGLILIQCANICFALGQVAYKRLDLQGIKTQIQHYALFFLGAAIVSGLGVLFFTNWQLMPSTTFQWGILVWLGVGASAGGYLAWSIASKTVNIGQLATMNNALIPAGILVNLLFWNTQAHWLSFGLGGALILFSVRLCYYKK